MDKETDPEVKQVNLRLDPDLLARIDETRGDVPRNTWIIRAIELRLMARNLTPQEIDRLLDDWHARSEQRQWEGSYDDTDRGIAIKAPKEGKGDGS